MIITANVVDSNLSLTAGYFYGHLWSFPAVIVATKTGYFFT